MTTSVPLFSVQIGKASQPRLMGEYQKHLGQIENGINKLLHPLHLYSDVDQYKSTCADGYEWIDVHLRESDQLSFVNELESSVGSNLRLLDIERQAATDATENALRTLRELQVRKTWKSIEILNLVERRVSARDATALGHGLQADDNSIRIQHPSGEKSEAAVPNRRFSALCVDPIELTFQPAYVGADGAFVSLSGESMRQIGSSLRLIKSSWTDNGGPSISEVLYQASTSHAWVSAQCKVVFNRSKKPKALLIQMVMP